MADSTILELSTPEAPKAIGPYSQAVVAGDLIFVSGQIPIDPGTAALVPGGIREQTFRVLKNIEAILKHRDAGFGNIVKTDVYLKNMNDFGGMNEVYASFFTDGVKPARVTVEVSKLPREALVEISCIAYLTR